MDFDVMDFDVMDFDVTHLDFRFLTSSQNPVISTGA
jgi:hypothetical protein